jgi:hypothetical protein
MTFIIAILISLGLLTSAADWDTLSTEQQEEYTEIVNQDIDAI